MHSSSRLTFRACIACLLLAAAHAAQADPIVADAFSGKPNAPLTGHNGPWGLHERQPDKADAPGTPWFMPNGKGGWGGDLAQYKGKPCAWLNADTRLRVSIASVANYTKPTHINVSAFVNLGWASATERGSGIQFGTDFHGVGVGFFAENGHRFTGPTLREDGSIFIHNQSTAVEPVVEARIPWPGKPGSFDPSAWHHISYGIDTTTGTLFDLRVDGRPFEVKTRIFTDAPTTFAGFYVNSWSGDTFGYVADFSVGTPQRVTSNVPATAPAPTNEPAK